MTWIDALVLGLVQGLAEFLPISSSGHLELAHALLGTRQAENLTFSIALHGATVLATLIVFWTEIIRLLKGAAARGRNAEKDFILKIALSMIPIAIVGLFLKGWVETFFRGRLLVVGLFLLLTAALLALASLRKPGSRSISFGDALVMGLAQAAAVMPGLSRSGSTIASGMLLGDRREDLAEFSFLMPIVPILGANVLDLLRGELSPASVGWLPLAVGFTTAFITGLLTCRWMISLVRRGKLAGFAVYCAAIGLAALLFSFFK
jgi:undecaprenyl-diphosphatase